MKRVLTPVLIFLALLMSACQPGNTPAATVTSAAAGGLTPYVTATLTPTFTSTPVNAPTSTLSPTQTPTPRPYTVKSNDTLIVIAFRNGLTVEELKAANPGVDPYLLTVGQTLYIPAPSNVSATQQAPTPLPEGMTVSAVTCPATASGGSYCFAALTNTQEYRLESISAEFRLADPAGGTLLTRPATLPVSRVAPGETVVVFAYFAPPALLNPAAQLLLQTALKAAEPSTRPVVNTGAPVVQINPDGLSAVVSGEALLEAESVAAQTLWVTAVALDSNGSPVGIRRLELAEGLKSGETKPYMLTVYSLAGSIASVSLYVDAIP
jgi:LysM repeat protein